MGILIQKKDEAFFREMRRGQTETLSDDQTSVVIEASGQCMLLVKVDKGIVRDTSQRIRKSDFLTYGLEKPYTHLIELKGKNIEEAYKQLQQTLDTIVAESGYGELVQRRDRIDAYIVSPNQQSIPRGNNSLERELARKLAARSGKKVSDIYDLIQYVKVVPRQERVSVKNRRIICSGKAPLPLA